jgi:hypothetical protein
MTRASVIAALAISALCMPSSSLTAQPATVDSGTRRVQLLVYLIDLVEISGSDQSFFADIFIEAIWQDPSLAGRSPNTYDLADFWNPGLLLVNQRDVSRSLPEIVAVDASGQVTYRQRFTGRFSATMNLRDFPLDNQRLKVQLITIRGGLDEVELAVMETATLRAQQFSITDWKVTDVRVERDDYSATPRARPLSGLALKIDVRREVKYYIVQILIPLIAIVLMSWTVFWIDPAVVATRMSVSVTTMLTLIAYRFMLGNLVPRLSYLTRLDFFMFGATALVILTLFAMAGTSYLTSRGQTAIVARIDRGGRILFPIILATYATVVWLS